MLSFTFKYKNTEKQILIGIKFYFPPTFTEL